MDFKNVYTSSKTYIVLTVVAFALLIFTTSTAYKQVMRMQQSAEMVSHSLQVYNTISLLTAHFTKADSEEFKDILLKPGKSDFTFENYREEGLIIIDSLSNLSSDNPLQINRLNQIKILLNDLYTQLQDIDAETLDENQISLKYKDAQKSIIGITLYQIRNIKNDMLAEEQRLMQIRSKAYASHKTLAPVTLLTLGFLALTVFILSFLRIYRNKLRIRQSENFLKNVLGTTDNVVNYYEPLYNDEQEIIDFEIIYANACNRDYFGIEPDDMLGKRVLEVFPTLKDNGGLENLKLSFNNSEKVKYENELIMNNETMHFQTLITPLSDGVLITARNITAEEKAKSTQLKLKKRLENQNLKLLDNRALLANIFKSISHVVMHLKSVRNEENQIIDFKIVFVNDRINPITGDIPEEIKNRRVSEVYPDIYSSGVFNNLVQALENKKSVEYEVPYDRNNMKMWFKATAIKLGDGITVTMREITQEKKKSEELYSLNEQLSIRNSILSDAESIAKIGSYLWYMDTDTSELSDNFYRILGYEPNEFISTSQKYRDFIHPDDLQQYDIRTKETFEGIDSDEFIYRIITKDGQTKHIKTNGQFLDKNGRSVMIGVVQDVTQNINSAENLRKSNLDLKRSNAELESFNRVASHDLQEPLRKIQLFVSRIEDMEGSSFSERGKNYFEKVKNAANRMQHLIQNLLAYSRIDSSNSHLEQINLNDVLVKVQEDLTASIKLNQAKVFIDNLPEINGIFFQMEQLFANLISNSLKYKSLTDTPELHITAEQVLAANLPIAFKTVSAQYHKITVSDNGIGFESKYAEKIFEVFQRLHQKTEYSGTGIGLAICKKIVENHNGYIYAIGKPGKGTEFIIFLPA